MVMLLLTCTFLVMLAGAVTFMEWWRTRMWERRSERTGELLAAAHEAIAKLDALTRRPPKPAPTRQVSAVQDEEQERAFATSKQLLNRAVAKALHEQGLGDFDV